MQDPPRLRTAGRFRTLGKTVSGKRESQRPDPLLLLLRDRTGQLPPPALPHLVPPGVQDDHLGRHPAAGLIILQWHVGLGERDAEECGQGVADAVPAAGGDRPVTDSARPSLESKAGGDAAKLGNKACRGSGGVGAPAVWGAGAAGRSGSALYFHPSAPTARVPASPDGNVSEGRSAHGSPMPWAGRRRHQ